MDRETRIELDDLRRDLTEGMNKIDNINSLMKAYGDVIDRLSLADERERKRKHGIYIKTDERLTYVISTIASIVRDTHRSFSARDIRYACKFDVGNYMASLRSTGLIESVTRGNYIVTNKFLTLHGVSDADK